MNLQPKQPHVHVQMILEGRVTELPQQTAIQALAMVAQSYFQDINTLGVMIDQLASEVAALKKEMKDGRKDSSGDAQGTPRGSNVTKLPAKGKRKGKAGKDSGDVPGATSGEGDGVEPTQDQSPEGGDAA